MRARTVLEVEMTRDYTPGRGARNTTGRAERYFLIVVTNPSTGFDLYHVAVAVPSGYFDSSEQNAVAWANASKLFRREGDQKHAHVVRAIDRQEYEQWRTHG